MSAARSVSAWLLLAVFAVGGAGAPSVHRAHHALDRAAVLATHTAASHHHHEAGDGHGTELQRSCLDALAVDWTCTLCGGIAGPHASEDAGEPPAAGAARLGAPSLVGEAEAPVRSRSIRGPPQA